MAGNRGYCLNDRFVTCAWLLAAWVVALCGWMSTRADAQSVGTPTTDPFAPLPPATAASNASDADAQKTIGIDRVYINDGSLLEGRLDGYAGGKFVVTTTGLGEMKIAPENVTRVSLERERIVYIQNEAGTPSRAVLLTMRADGSLGIREANSSTVQPINFAGINEMRGQPIPAAIWTGKLTAAASADVGNTDALNFGIKAEVLRDSKTEQLKLDAEFSFTQTNNAVTKRLIQGGVLYRYFFSDEFGLFGEDRIRKDVIAGTKLRNSVNLGGTIRLISKLEESLTFDIGLAYTFESLVSGDETQFFGAVARGSYRQDFGDWSLLIEESFDTDLSELQRFTLQTNLELRLALGTELSVALRGEDTYKGMPSTGFRRNDLRVLFLLSFVIKSS